MTKERFEGEGLFGWLRLGCVGLVLVVVPVWLILAAILAPHTQSREFEPFWEWLLRSAGNVVMGCWWSVPWMATLSLLLLGGLCFGFVMRWLARRQDVHERKSMDGRLARSVVLPESAWNSIVVKHTREGVPPTDEVPAGQRESSSHSSTEE